MFLLACTFASCHSTRRLQTSPLPVSIILTTEEQRKYDYFFLEAVRLRINEEYDAAFCLLQHCLVINPYAASAHYEIAQCHFLNRQKALGEEALIKAVTYAPDNFWYSQILVNVYHQQEQRQQAMELLQAMTERFPDKYEILTDLAELYNSLEEYQKAIDTLNSLEAKTGKTEQLSLERLHIYLQMNNQDQALKELENLTGEYAAEAQLLYAQYLLSTGKEEQAMPVFQTVLQEDPGNMAARMVLLNYAIRKENNGQVILLCQSGIDVSPQLPEYYYYLGLACYQEDRLDDALEVFHKALVNINEDETKNIVSEFYSIMGDIYYRKKQQPDAYMAYDSALVYNPANIGALNNYAYYLSVERHDLDKAQEMSYRTIQQEPQNYTYLDTYAWILFEKGNYTGARTYIDDAVKNGGEISSVVMEHCGDIYYMNGYLEDALEYWLKAKEMGSESETLERKIKQKKYIAE
jgi:tetratricopeptide (TPR) repeat protein